MTCLCPKKLRDYLKGLLKSSIRAEAPKNRAKVFNSRHRYTLGKEEAGNVRTGGTCILSGSGGQAFTPNP